MMGLLIGATCMGREPGEGVSVRYLSARYCLTPYGTAWYCTYVATNLRQITTYLTPDQVAGLEVLAATNYWTVAATVRWVVGRYLAEERREPGTGAQ